MVAMILALIQNRRDAVLERAEREEANQRLRTWRCEQLVY